MSKAINDSVKRKEYETSQTEAWFNINWKQVSRKVYKLQKRIYEATQRGDIGAARSLQKTLVNSWSAKVLAVRKVTQDNRGKNTAGIDGVKTLKPNQRIQLVERLKLSSKSKPVKRVWIPKPNKNQKRPLGIPTIEERATQALLKMALEPEWEAKFEPHSYGFRPARSTHDAITYIHKTLSTTDGKWVYDADISGCFDNIDHKALLDKINTCPTFRRQIKAWLKSGVIDLSNKGDKKGFTPSTSGTTQGGVISPLLANIALHGLEKRLKDWLWNEKKYRIPEWNATKQKWGTAKQAHTKATLSVVRYADDFLVIHPNQEIIEEAKQVVEEFLAEIGLEIKPSKTQIVHSTEGFDFLGVNIKHYKTGEYRSAKRTNGKPTGYVVLITPSKQAVQNHYQRLAKIVDSHRALPQEYLIKHLNPIIRGWCNYYKPYVSKEVFVKLDHLLTQKLIRWAKRRHPNKPRQWAYRKYFTLQKGDKWTFRSDINTLVKHSGTSIVRQITVKGEASFYDGNLAYWAKRVSSHPMLNNTELNLIKKQKGICPHCKGRFNEGNLWEIDHINPLSEGGKREVKNLQLIPKHCHFEKTRNERMKATKSRARNCAVSQERCEVKVSRIVLKTSGNREVIA
ncbi:MAG: group II intron reverse transcriptase/maturase [Symploca sp. SIO2B6]|nr:group II intron reverse transcriptase/maturase [Symploca sp. SIO2B6]